MHCPTGIIQSYRSVSVLAPVFSLQELHAEYIYCYCLCLATPKQSHRFDCTQSSWAIYLSAFYNCR